MEGAEPAELLGARRWLILGSGGSGKSTFSTELARLLGLPLVHLDRHYWKPGWVPSTKDEWLPAVRALASEEQWIMDGNYSGTIESRLERAEVAVLLDVPTWRALYGIFRRAWRYRGKIRPDLPDGCPEHFPDREFLWFVASYKWRSLPRTLRLIGEAEHVSFVHLRSHAEARRFLDSISRAVDRPE